MIDSNGENSNSDKYLSSKLSFYAFRLLLFLLLLLLVMIEIFPNYYIIILIALQSRRSCISCSCISSSRKEMSI